jgi:hypothetical protein
MVLVSVLLDGCADEAPASPICGALLTKKYIWLNASLFSGVRAHTAFRSVSFVILLIVAAFLDLFYYRCCACTSQQKYSCEEERDSDHLTLKGAERSTINRQKRII